MARHCCASARAVYFGINESLNQERVRSMKAVAFTHSKPITDFEALMDFDLPTPMPRHHDLLVEIKAVSVNPVDTKIRRAGEPLGEPRVLGFDAAGIVRDIGPDVQNFAVGDEVFYAGVPT